MLPPHELKNKTFSKAMRGYNPVEVDEYIDFVIEKYTELYRENDELERKLKAAMTRLDSIKNDEDSIRSALIDAKRAANKIKSDAEARAESIIRSAKNSCNTILSDFNEKIAYARDINAELQRDTLALKQELFNRYSDHIRYIDKLTEGIDVDAIPEVSELRRKAVEQLKADISSTYAAAPADSSTEDYESSELYGENGYSGEASNELVPVDGYESAEPQELNNGVYADASSDDVFGDSPEPELETVREPLSSKNSLKDSIIGINKKYKESDEDFISTPDSDLADDESYLDFVKSVTGKRDIKKDNKDADFDMLFDDGKKKRK